MKRNYRQFYALLSKCGLSEEKKALVREFSDGRTESLKELTDKEFTAMQDYLSQKANVALDKDSTDLQRKKFIAIMRSRGFEKLTARYMSAGRDTFKVADMTRIYDWVTNNPKSCMKGKQLNDLTSSELSKLITQVSSIKMWYEEQENIKEILK